MHKVVTHLKRELFLSLNSKSFLMARYYFCFFVPSYLEYSKYKLESVNNRSAFLLRKFQFAEVKILKCPNVTKGLENEGEKQGKVISQ